MPDRAESRFNENVLPNKSFHAFCVVEQPSKQVFFSYHLDTNR